MKKLILFLILISNLFAEGMPSWVTEYENTGSIQNQNDYYFGVGESKISQGDADKTALANFGMSIETKVKSEISSILKEKNGKISDSFTENISITSDIGLRGISITKRYSEEGNYYSLIQYLKKDYNKILKDEIKRDLERQKMDLNKKIEENKLAENEEKERLRQEREKQNMENVATRLKEGRMRDLKYKYPDFFKKNPPYKNVSFRNGQLIPQKAQINIKGGLSPISINELFLAYKLWLLEFSAKSNFVDNKYNRQEVQLKYQILPYSGDFYKFSSSFGFTAYKTQLDTSDFFEAELIYSPFIAGNISIPNLHFSYVSVYADLGQTSIAINNYVFYKQLKEL